MEVHPCAVARFFPHRSILCVIKSTMDHVAEEHQFGCSDGVTLLSLIQFLCPSHTSLYSFYKYKYPHCVAVLCDDYGATH